MSTFSEKLLQGLVPNDQDWEAHLIEVHARSPQMTPEAYAGFKSEDGFSSYELLAGLVPESSRDINIIDLACGDGHLIPYLLSRVGKKSKIVGVDIGAEGLELARTQIRDPRVSFELARAQALPFPDAFADMILSHMAFMLMTPIEPVVAEIRRVLKPGGTFAALMSAGASEGLYNHIRRLIGLFVHAHLPKLTEARGGSAKARNLEGWRELFADGFSGSVEEREFKLRFHVPPEGVWDYLKSMYFTPLFPDYAYRELRDDLLALARGHCDAEGKVLFFVPMKYLMVRK